MFIKYIFTVEMKKYKKSFKENKELAKEYDLVKKILLLYFD
jgi:hypothetical protein